MTHRRPRAAAIVLAVLLPLALAGCTVIDGSSGDATPYASPMQVTPIDPDPTAVTPQDAPPASTATTSLPTSSSASTLPPAVTLATGPTAAFVMPSGNITCVLTRGTGSSASVRCDIRRASFTVPTPPADCHGDWGPTVELGEGAGFACVFDSVGGLAVVPPHDPPAWMLGPYDAVPTVDGVQQAVLGYGHTLAMGTVRCDSERVGVRCSDAATGAGFLLSMASATFTPATRPTSRPPGTVDVGGFLGTWDHAKRQLTVLPDGEISLRAPAEDRCSTTPTPPCDTAIDGAPSYGVSLVLHTVHGPEPTDPSRLDAVVVASNDRSLHVGTRLELSLDTSADTVSVPSFPSFCGPRGTTDDCGG